MRQNHEQSARARRSVQFREAKTRHFVKITTAARGPQHPRGPWSYSSAGAYRSLSYSSSSSSSEDTTGVLVV
jgi:hypothetical protein